MSAALLSLAAALLAWPGPTRHRLTRLVRHPSAGRLRWRPERLRPVHAAVLGAAVGGASSTPLVAALAAGCSALAARAVARRRTDLEEESQARAVTGALGALAAELRAGRPLDSAVVAAARPLDEDLGGALVRAVRAGPRPGAGTGPTAEALRRLTAAVRLSGRTGASLAEVVTAVEDDLRARQVQQHELRSAVAAPRASAALLAGLPLLGLAMGSGVGAHPWQILTRTGTGQVLLVVGVLLEVAGVHWSGRLVARATRGPAPVPP